MPILSKPAMPILSRSLLLCLLSALLPAAFADVPFETTSSMRDETQLMIYYLERQHFLGRPLAELDHAELIETYMDRLDRHRLFFMRDDLRDFQGRFADNMPRFLNRGQLYPAFAIFHVFKQRARERIAGVLERIDGPFDFDTREVYTPDRSEADWPASKREADILWEHRLTYELLNEVLNSLPELDKDDTDGARSPGLFLEKEAFLDGLNTGNPTLRTAAVRAVLENRPQAETEAILDYLRERVANWQSDDDVPDAPDGLGLTADEVLEIHLATARENIRRRYQRTLDWVEELEPTQVQEIFLTSLTNNYDPHSTFLSAESMEEFAIAMRNALVGIGAVLSDEDGYCTIREILPGGPAEQSRKLHPNDAIVGVAQGEDGEMVDTIGMKLNRVVRLIRGEVGTTVRLLIRPGDGDPSERREISLVRDEIQLTAKLARAEVFQVPAGDQTIPVGVIYLPAFYGSGDPQSGHSSTTADVEELIGKLKDMGVEAIVLDLRNNGGGLLSEAISLTGLFIPSGPVVQVKDFSGQMREYEDPGSSVAWDGPLAVLISRRSASASEIAAGALRNHGRAVVIGDRGTHGKGTVQAVFEMNRSGFLSGLNRRRGAAKITIQQFYLPDGSSTQLEGVAADIALPSINDYLPIGESDLPKALPHGTIAPLTWEYEDAFTPRGGPLDESLIVWLREQSELRRQSLPEFDYLERSIEWFRERQEQTEFSLNLQERRKQRQQDNQFRDTMREELRELSVLNFDFQEVLLALSVEQQAKSQALLDQAEAERREAAEPLNGEAVTSERPSVADHHTAPLEGDTDDEIPLFDIHLREALRIMSDWFTHKIMPQSKESLAAAPSKG